MSDKNVFSITTQRFRKLIDNEKYSKVPRAEIAKATECDTSTITKYYNGQRQLSVDSIIKFSKYFNVSSDYLLGLSDAATTDIDIKAICEYTGLNEFIIKLLNEQKKQEINITEFCNNIKLTEEERNNQLILSTLCRSDLNFINKLLLWALSEQSISDFYHSCYRAKQTIKNNVENEFDNLINVYDCAAKTKEEVNHLNGSLFVLNNAFTKFISKYFDIKTLKKQLSKINSNAATELKIKIIDSNENESVKVRNELLNTLKEINNELTSD